MLGWIAAYLGLRAVNKYDRALGAQVHAQRREINALKGSVRDLINNPETELTPSERALLLRRLGR